MIVARSKLFNIRVIANLIGKVLIIVGIAMLVPALVSVIYGEADWLPFLACGVATTAIGALLAFCIRLSRTSLSAHDGILITALAWVVIAVVGAVPFMLCTHPVGPTDALFESMSGFSTTGVSVMTDVESLGHGVNMWRALTQWIGGLGIILFTLTLIPMLNKSGGMRLMEAESSDFTFDKTSPRIMQTARNLALTYLALSLGCALLLWAGPMDLYDSLVHAFSTLSTGGFSPYADGIMHFASAYVKCVIIVFMFLGATNFTLLAFAGKGNFKPLLGNSTFRIYGLTVIAFTLLFIGSMLLAGFGFSVEGMIVDPLFNVISCITTTGYAAANYELWGPLVFVFLMILMFSGASMGSTSGGAKLDRLIVFFRNARKEIVSTVNHNTLYTINDGAEKHLDRTNLLRIITFIGIYAVTLLVGSILLMALGIGMSDAFFAVFSCTSNVGLGYGATGFDGSFALMPDAAKWILFVLMYLGRLELITVLVLLVPSFWHR